MPATTATSIDRATLASLLAPVGEVGEVTELTGGMFATAYLVVTTDGRELVVKAGQAGDAVGLLRHEHDMLSTEVDVLRRAANRPWLRMPRLVHVDASRRLLDAEVMVTTKVPGRRWDTVEDDLSPAAADRAATELGGIMAGLHSITGDRFGYPGDGRRLSGATWPEAFAAVVTAVLDDARDWSVPVPDDVPVAVERMLPSLGAVRVPALVHMDLWPGNVFVDPASGAVTGVIDAERALWADPLMELAGAEPFRTGAPSPALAAGYLAAGGQFDLGPDGLARLALYRLYLNLVMTVEVVPRRYQGPWLAPYLDRLAAQRATLLTDLH